MCSSDLDVFTSLISLKYLDFPPHFIVLRPFHHLPVFDLHSNSLIPPSSLSLCFHLISTTTNSPLFHLISFLVFPNLFLFRLSSFHPFLSSSLFSFFPVQQSCLHPTWSVLKSQQTQISLLPIHQSPFSMMFISLFIN